MQIRRASARPASDTAQTSRHSTIPTIIHGRANGVDWARVEAGGSLEVPDTSWDMPPLPILIPAVIVLAVVGFAVGAYFDPLADLALSLVR